MRPIQNAEGHVGLTARNYPIDSGTAVTAGQVVTLRDGKIVPAVTAQTGAIAGIAGEDHSGQADVLNPRSDGEEILVCDSPGLLFECRAPEIIAASGTASTLAAAEGQVAAGIANGAFKGGVLTLRRKAAESGNTDVYGQRRGITGYTAGGTFALTAGGVPGEGDVYEVYPPIGSAVCALDESVSALVVSAAGATAIRVVGHDYDRHMVRCMAALHTLN